MRHLNLASMSILAFTSSLILALAGCGPGISNNADSAYSRNTGFANEKGIAYTTNGDARVGQYSQLNELTEAAPKKPETTPAATPTQTPTKVTLRTRIRDIEVSRFKADSTTPARFGDSQIVFKIFFVDQEPLEMRSALNSKSSRSVIEASAAGYTLAGTLDDNAPVGTLADLSLVKTDSPDDSAQLLYRAYKAGLTVTETGETKLATNSPTAQAIESLRKDAFGWVHNWAIVGGRSFYVVDIVKTPPGGPDKVNKNSTSNNQTLLSFRGESLSTETQTQPTQVQALPSTDAHDPHVAQAPEVTLVKNDDDHSRRVFDVSYREPQTTTVNHVQVAVEADPQAQMLKLKPQSPPTAKEQKRTDAPAPAKSQLPVQPSTVAVPTPLPTPRPTLPTDTQKPVTTIRPAAPVKKTNSTSRNDSVAPKEQDTFLYIKSASPRAQTQGEPITEGMCMADNQGSHQMRRGYCRQLWNTLTQAGPVKRLLDLQRDPDDIKAYCPNFDRLKSEPTKRALVYMALLSAIAYQESNWKAGLTGEDAGSSNGIYQLANGDRQIYREGCHDLVLTDPYKNIRCGAYIAIKNMVAGNQISEPSLQSLAMSHYFGSVQRGRSEQKKIAAKVKSYCQALGGTAI